MVINETEQDKPEKRLWLIDKPKNRTAPTLRVNFESVKDEATILFLGDLHWDNPSADLKGIKKLLDEAKQRDAAIVLLGDTFCAMQGKSDKRGMKGSVRPEHQRNDYFSALIDTASEWFEPYAKNIWVMLEGNHESAIVKHNEIDLTKHLVNNLNQAGGNIQYPGYSSYAVVRARYFNQYYSKNFWLTHGHGGGGEVTKGTIQAHRRAVTYPDADYVISGHIHSVYHVEHEQWRIDNEGRPYAASQEHYTVQTWKDEFHAGKGGFHVEKGRGPRLSSGWWAKFRHSKNGLAVDWIKARPE
jgi:UDP-2,3-diacylglucosamine pyrophosphatase LpxH